MSLEFLGITITSDNPSISKEVLESLFGDKDATATKAICALLPEEYRQKRAEFECLEERLDKLRNFSPKRLMCYFKAVGLILQNPELYHTRA